MRHYRVRREWAKREWARRESVQCEVARSTLARPELARRAGLLRREPAIAPLHCLTPPAEVGKGYGAGRPYTCVSVVAACQCQLQKVRRPWEGVSRTRL